MVKIGVIGVGHMGEYHVNVLKYLSRSGFVEFVGVFDINKKRMQYISKKYEVKAYDTIDSLLKDVNAVNIAVWTSKHYEVAKKALEAGVNVLIEKPFAHLYGLAEEVAEIAYKKNLIIQVGHVERFNGAVVELRKRYINNPFFFEARRYGLRSNKVRDTGVILDLMVHDIDIIHSFINGSKPPLIIDGFAKRIYTDYEDFAHAILMYENNTIAAITCSRASYVKLRTLGISQKSNYIFLNYDTQEIEIYKKSSTLFEVDQRELIYHRGSFIEKISVHVENPLKDEIMHFINCVDGKETPIFKTETDLLVLKIVFEILKKAGIKDNFKYEVDI